MKFKFLYSLSATILTGLMANMGLGIIFYNVKKPANTGNKIQYITTQMDTVNVSDDTFKQSASFTAGVFMPISQKIKINYFTTNSQNPRIQKFCDQSNNQIRLVIRHEKEHARKANLTKNTWFYDPKTRGAIAAHNEIIAPAAEIIEALDARYETGHAFPTNRYFVSKADKLIVKYATENKLEWPLDFNNQHIADIIIQCSLERFISELSRGMYKTTIKKAITKSDVQKQYITNNLCNMHNQFIFNPSINAWSPMWQFESKRGSVDLWNAASQQQKDKLMATIDSIVLSIAGKNQLFLQNSKTR